jgi:LPXTG-site transpeptidase (sortase) family protein
MNNQEQFKIKKKRKLSDLNKKEKITLFLQIVGVFGVFAFIIYSVGFLPDELKGPEKESASEVSESNVDIEENLSSTRPSRIYIDKIGVDSNIELPNSQNIDVLDESLKKGAVHYPGSGSLEQGNIFIFGHSTNWKIVKNQSYKTFNNLEKLVPGDEIKLEADGVEYKYIVDSVILANESDALVNLDTTEQKLTISTCNSFGERQERWVVEAYRI